jgi:RNA recognition motif-containing protein
MNIHVTNLSRNVIAADLTRLFSAYGMVGFALVVRDLVSGRSKGVAFVEMPVQVQAEQALMALHLMEIDGQQISVQEIEYRPGEFNN